VGGQRRQRKMRPRQRESRVRGAGAAEVCSVGSFVTWTQRIQILIGPTPGLCVEDVCLICVCDALQAGDDSGDDDDGASGQEGGEDR
jgi:hypothetical protein